MYKIHIICYIINLSIVLPIYLTMLKLIFISPSMHSEEYKDEERGTDLKLSSLAAGHS